MSEKQKNLETGSFDKTLHRLVGIIDDIGYDHVDAGGVFYMTSPNNDGTNTTLSVCISPNETEEIPSIIIQRMEWLIPEHQGYGPHLLKIYSLYKQSEQMRIECSTSLESTNGDPREVLINSGEMYELVAPPGLSREVSAHVQQSDGLAQAEPTREEILEWLFKGDFQESQMGLNVVSEEEVTELIHILEDNSPTHNPYFEQE